MWAVREQRRTKVPRNHLFPTFCSNTLRGVRTVQAIPPPLCTSRMTPGSRPSPRPSAEALGPFSLPFPFSTAANPSFCVSVAQPTGLGGGPPPPASGSPCRTGPVPVPPPPSLTSSSACSSGHSSPPRLPSSPSSSACSSPTTPFPIPSSPTSSLSSSPSTPVPGPRSPDSSVPSSPASSSPPPLTLRDHDDQMEAELAGVQEGLAVLLEQRAAVGRAMQTLRDDHAKALAQHSAPAARRAAALGQGRLPRLRLDRAVLAGELEGLQRLVGALEGARACDLRALRGALDRELEALRPLADAGALAGLLQHDGCLLALRRPADDPALVAVVRAAMVLLDAEYVDLPDWRRFATDAVLRGLPGLDCAALPPAKVVALQAATGYDVREVQQASHVFGVLGAWVQGVAAYATRALPVQAARAALDTGGLVQARARAHATAQQLHAVSAEIQVAEASLATAAAEAERWRAELETAFETTLAALAEEEETLAQEVAAAAAHACATLPPLMVQLDAARDAQIWLAGAAQCPTQSLAALRQAMQGTAMGRHLQDRGFLFLVHNRPLSPSRELCVPVARALVGSAPLGAGRRRWREPASVWGPDVPDQTLAATAWAELVGRVVVRCPGPEGAVDWPWRERVLGPGGAGAAREEGAWLDEPDALGRRALHDVAAAGGPGAGAAAEALLDRGAGLLVRDWRGATPLHVAAARARPALAAALLRAAAGRVPPPAAGPPPPPGCALCPPSGPWPRHDCGSGPVGVLRTALRARDAAGRTPLHVALAAARAPGAAEVAEALLEHKACVGALDGQGTSCLALACAAAPVPLLRRLLDAGALWACVAWQDAGQDVLMPVLEAAVRRGDLPVAEAVCDAFLDAERRQALPLPTAAARAATTGVGRAAPAACAGVRDVAFHGGVGGPLQMACEAGHAALVRMLLDKGFNPCLYRGYGVPFLAEDMVVAGDSAIIEVLPPGWWSYCTPTPSLLRMTIPRPLHNPPPLRVTLPRVAGFLRGPGRPPVRPFACCVGSLRSAAAAAGVPCGVVAASAGPDSWCTGGCAGCYEGSSDGCCCPTPPRRLLVVHHMPHPCLGALGRF